MTTVREELIRRLIESGLWPKEAEKVFNLMLDAKLPNMNEVKFGDPFHSYPNQLYAGILLYLHEFAVKWIDANKPLHFARSMFTGELTPMTREQVESLMRSSTSESDWNDNCDKVKKNHGGEYPSYWFLTIIVSGLLEKVRKEW